MSEATVRAAVYAIVNAVSNVGNVYDYDRWAAFLSDQYDKVLSRISGSTVARFWTISLSEGNPIGQEMTRFSSDRRTGAMRTYTYRIRGAFGLDDDNASEKTAASITEDVMEAIDGDTSLQENYHAVAPCQLTTFELRHIGPWLFHYAEIVLAIQERQ